MQAKQSLEKNLKLIDEDNINTNNNKNQKNHRRI